MSEEQRAKIVLRILNKIYPKTPIPLKHRNMFTLLVSVLLSAQCTDVNVNNVTKDIYKNVKLFIKPKVRGANFNHFTLKKMRQS